MKILFKFLFFLKFFEHDPNLRSSLNGFLSSPIYYLRKLKDFFFEKCFPRSMAKPLEDEERYSLVLPVMAYYRRIDSGGSSLAG